jgi:hypothetical protein
MVLCHGILAVQYYLALNITSSNRLTVFLNLFNNSSTVIPFRQGLETLVLSH